VNLEIFTRHRSLVFTVAYEMLGSAADAEDVVQETWLRWEAVDTADIQDPRAYLVRTVTRQSLNRLRTRSRSREDYIGDWLPEPLLTSADVADDVELAENVSMAVLTVLETLTPLERAVFVLREVFEVPHTEIAVALDRSPAAIRQIAHRAREHVHARRPRIPVTGAEHAHAVDFFLTALRGGDVGQLLEVLAPDVVLVSDTGGLAPALARPVTGATKVAKLLARIADALPTAELEPVLLNGRAGVRILLDDETHTAVSLVVEDGRITHVYAVRNPNKLHRLDHEVHLTRDQTA
jgi:RNA polymerase sigma-70 factor (TIGR02957 family)